MDKLGVVEHVWVHPGPPDTAWSSGIVDHTRDADGAVHARLLDAFPGRSGKATPTGSKNGGTGFTAGIKTAGAGSVPRVRERDPVTSCPKPSQFWMPFHVVKLGSAMVNRGPPGPADPGTPRPHGDPL